MNIETVRPTLLGGTSTAKTPFDPMQVCVPYNEADQTYCNGGSALRGFDAVKAIPIRGADSVLQAIARQK